MKILNVTLLIAVVVGVCQWGSFVVANDPFAFIPLKHVLAVGAVYIAAMSAVGGHQLQR